MPDTWLLKGNGIIDEVALSVAVRGLRAVRLTRREREIAALIMRRNCRGAGYDEDGFANLVRCHLSLPSHKAAVALVCSLRDDARSRATVRYWTDERYREREQARKRDGMRAGRAA